MYISFWWGFVRSSIWQISKEMKELKSEDVWTSFTKRYTISNTHTHIYSHIRYNTLIVIFNASVNVWIQPKKKQKPDISMITLVQTTKKKEKRNESHFYLSYISNTNIFTFIRDGSSSDEWFKVLQIAFVCCQFQPLNVYHLWST